MCGERGGGYTGITNDQDKYIDEYLSGLTSILSLDFDTFKVFFFFQKECRNEEIELNIYRMYLHFFTICTSYASCNIIIIIYQHSYVTKTY
jgi:hypothetical protein